MNLGAFTRLRPSDDEVATLAPPPGSDLAEDVHTPESVVSQEEPNNQPETGAESDNS